VEDGFFRKFPSILLNLYPNSHFLSHRLVDKTIMSFRLAMPRTISRHSNFVNKRLMITPINRFLLLRHRSTGEIKTRSRCLRSLCSMLLIILSCRKMKLQKKMNSKMTRNYVKLWIFKAKINLGVMEDSKTSYGPQR
jgi:hypothetical protein